MESDNDPNPRSRLNVLKEKYLGVQAVYNKMKVSDDPTTVTDAEKYKKKESVDPAEAEFNAARSKLTAEYIKRWETNDNIMKKIINNNLTEDMLDIIVRTRLPGQTTTASLKRMELYQARLNPTWIDNGWL